MTNEVLSTLGHRSRVALGGQEGIRAAAAGRLDVVFIDVNMPDVDGYSAAKRIKTMLPGVRVVGISGLNLQETSTRADPSVFDRFLKKPFRPADVREALQALFP